MNWFSNLKIARKIMLSTGLLMLLIVLTGSVALFGYNAMRASLQTVYTDRLVPSLQLGEIMDLMNANTREVLLAIQHDPIVPVSKAHEATHHVNRHIQIVKDNIEKISAIWQTYMASEMTPEEKRLATEFSVSREAFVKKGLLEALHLLENDDFEAAALHMVKTTIPLFKTATDNERLLLHLQQDVAKAEMERANHMNEQFIGLMIGVSVIAFLGLLISLWISRQITGPLNTIVGIVGQVAEGDLSVEIDIQRQDRMK